MTTDELIYLTEKRAILRRELRILRSNWWDANRLEPLHMECDRVNTALRFYDDWSEADRINSLTPEERIKQMAQQDVYDIIRAAMLDEKGKP